MLEKIRKWTELVIAVVLGVTCIGLTLAEERYKGHVDGLKATLKRLLVWDDVS